MDSGHTDIAMPRKGALGFFLVLMALYALLGGSAQHARPLAGLLWTEVFVFVLVPVLAAVGSNLRPAPFLLLSRNPTGRQLLLGAASGVALFLAAGAVMSLTTTLLPRSWVDAFDIARLFEGSRRHQLGMALAASLLAPLAEELAFRGYVLSALRTHLPPGPAIAGSALLFAALHLDPVRFPAVLLLGLFLGWLAWRSGSIWPAVAAHAVNNALGSALIANGGSDASAEGSVSASLAMLVVGVAALAPVAVGWIRATPAPPPASETIVPRNPADPSIRFRLARIPVGWTLVASVGLMLYLILRAFPVKGA